MLNENEKDVNAEEEVNPSPSPEQDEAVNENPEGAEPSAQDTPTAEPEQEPQQPAAVTPVAPTPQTHPELFDDQGILWKNRAVEERRKLQDAEALVKETVEKTLQSQNKKEVYTREHIPKLKQYAIDHPERAEWVDQEIEDVRARETANLVEEKFTTIEKKRQDGQTRQQAEGWITTDPVFKTCFVDTPSGKQWNSADPLAQHVMQVLNSTDPSTGKLVKDRPDALYIAADIAYGRYARMNIQKSGGQVKQLRKDLAKAQKVAIVPGAGKPAPATPSRSPVRKALDNFAKSSSKVDLQEATKQHLLGIGVIKEE